MLDERAEGDPLEGARIMLAGRAEQAGDAEEAVLRRRYLNAHPSAEAFVNFKDFSFFRIGRQPRIWWPVLAGSSTSTPEQFLTDISDADALLEAEQGAIEHMNADHRDAMNLYATKTARRGSKPTGAAPAAIPMEWTCRPASRRCGWNFRGAIVTPAALRKVLKELAEQARAATSG